jgi:hypothetical protein
MLRPSDDRQVEPSRMLDARLIARSNGCNDNLSDPKQDQDRKCEDDNADDPATPRFRPPRHNHLSFSEV